MADTRDFQRFEVGDTASLEQRVDPEAVARFSRLTGDDNPVHLDAGFAAAHGLPGPIVHGVLTTGYLSTVIGTLLPGPGALWLSSRLQFRAPVRVGETIRVEVRIRCVSPGTRVLVLDVEVRGGTGDVVLDGEAQVHVLARQADVSMDGESVQTAVVTGSGRGIGAAIAKHLAGSGVRVALNYRSDESSAQETLAAIRDQGGDAALFQADLSVTDEATGLISAATEAFGRIDALINNAGGPPEPRPLSDTGWEDVERHLMSHLRAGFVCTQAVLPGMIERGFGRIVNVTSQTAYGVPAPKMTGYSVAKAALAAFTRSAALEAGPHGVTVNAVAPGVVATEMRTDLTPRGRAVLESQIPLRRIARVEDVAEAVGYLVGPGGSFLTGQTIHLDGGQEMR